MFALMLRCLLLAALAVPGTASALSLTTIADVSSTSINCHQNGLSSAQTACGGAVGIGQGQASASASVGVGVVRATAAAGLMNTAFAGHSVSASGQGFLREDLLFTFNDSLIHYVVFNIGVSGSISTTGAIGSGSQASGGVTLTGVTTTSVTAGISVIAGGGPPVGVAYASTAAFPLSVTNGQSNEMLLSVGAFATIKGNGGSIANLGNTGYVTSIDVYDDSALTQLTTSTYSIVGESGLDYATLNIVLPEPSLALLLAPVLVGAWLVRRRSW